VTQPDRHRPVVYQGDLHVRAEAADRNGYGKTRFEHPHEIVECRRCDIRRRRARPRRTMTFARGREERELGDGEHVPARIDQRAIHHTLGVVEDAEIDHFSRNPFAIFARVVDTDRCKYQQARVDGRDPLPVHTHARLCDTLKERSQRRRPTVTVSGSPCARPARAGRVRT
jgi:hypothetical protein